MAKPTYVEERARCLKLVEEYREYLERVVAEGRARKDYMKLVNVLDVGEKVIASLYSIESQIRSPRKRTGADFTMDELAIAEEVIAQQSRNPFEVEP